MAYIPIDSEAESLTVSSTAVGFSSPPANATKAICQVLSQPIRFYVDGSTPTASAGFSRVAGQEVYLYGQEIQKVKFIREGGTDATIEGTFYSGHSSTDDDA